MVSDFDAMACFSPLKGYYSKDIGKSGKRGITFQRGASFSGVTLSLPCGQCVGCRLEKSRQWAMRCLHEKSLHESSGFITLTYDDSHLPEGGTLVKRDFQLFMKRMRKRIFKETGRKIRFYACGEYGDTFGRPHYHALIFGYDFPDKVFFKRGKSGEPIYTSKYLRELWPYGFNAIGEVTFESAAYVARYIMKKITGDLASDNYDVITSDGVFVSRLPEYTDMSRRPGIAFGWFEKWHKGVFQHDSVVVNGMEVRPPRFYDSKFELVDSDRLLLLKKIRRRKALAFRKDNTVDRLRVREVFELKKLRLFGREL